MNDYEPVYFHNAKLQKSQIPMKTIQLALVINLFVFLLFLVLSLRPYLECGCGEIGRHARLRIWCRKVCGFESLHPHNSNYNRTIL